MKLLATSEKRMLASVLAEAVIKLAEEKIGALITIERNVSLNEYTDLGVKIDGEVTSQLLQSIFIKGSPLHDGAVIIRLGRIECASTYFPLTNKKYLVNLVHVIVLLLEYQSKPMQYQLLSVKLMVLFQ